MVDFKTFQQIISKNIFLSLLFLSLGWSSLYAQGSPFDISVELQAYPTGFIPGAQFEKGFADSKAIHVRLGYNFVRHGDAGVHEDEKGGGFGFTLGYKSYIKGDFSGLFWGVRNDFWFNEVDWKDNIGTPEEVSGTANIVVVQPTAEAGYLFNIGSDKFLTPKVALGIEINFGEGLNENVGEGLILLLGINFGKRF